MKKITILAITLAILFVGCDKDKRASKRLIKPGNWIVTASVVDGSSISNETITWNISECDIYEELCQASWDLNGSTSEFYWQFNDKASTFTISRVVAPEDCEDFYTEKVEQMTYSLSGEYEVIESKRKSKIFESKNTLGYAGTAVRLEVE